MGMVCIICRLFMVGFPAQFQGAVVHTAPESTRKEPRTFDQRGMHASQQANAVQPLINGLKVFPSHGRG